MLCDVIKNSAQNIIVHPIRNIDTGDNLVPCYDFNTFLPTRTYINFPSKKRIFQDNNYFLMKTNTRQVEYRSLKFNEDDTYREYIKKETYRDKDNVPIKKSLY